MKATVKALLILPILFLIVGVFARPVFAENHEAPEEQAMATTAEKCATTSLLGFPTWYKYLLFDNSDDCNVIVDTDITNPNGELINSNVPWLIAAAVLEMLLRIVTYAAVVMIFWGGFQIMTSSGNSESVGKGRNKILNGIYGFIIAMMATAIVSYTISSLVGDVGRTSQGLPDVIDGGVGAVAFALNLVYRLAAGITVIIITISGFNFLISGGDPQRVSHARNGIIYAIVGLVITLLAFIIISSIGGRI